MGIQGSKHTSGRSSSDSGGAQVHCDRVHQDEAVSIKKPRKRRGLYLWSLSFSHRWRVRRADAAG